MLLKCEYCGKEFEKTKINQRFCSTECQNKANCGNWYLKNKDKVKETSKAYKDRKNELRRKKYAENKEYREKLQNMSREYSRKNPEKRKLQRALKNYGVTEEKYNEMLKKQNGKCAICGYSDTTVPNFFPLIDHCHKTNKVRGLLCMNCNMALGKFKDNIEILKNAIKYLQEVS